MNSIMDTKNEAMTGVGTINWDICFTGRVGLPIGFWYYHIEYMACTLVVDEVLNTFKKGPVVVWCLLIVLRKSQRRKDKVGKAT